MEDEATSGHHFTEAINQLLVAVNCPKTTRHFIDTLIGYAGGETKVEVSDLALGRRADNYNNDRSDDSAKKWVQRKRNTLQKWQEEKQVFLIEFSPGFRSGEKPNIVYVASSYILHISEHARQVLINAHKEPTWGNQPNKAIRKAAINEAKNIVSSPVVFTPRRPKNRDISKEIAMRLNTAITYIEKTSELLEQNNLILDGENEALAQALGLAVSHLDSFFSDEEI